MSEHGQGPAGSDGQGEGRDGQVAGPSGRGADRDRQGGSGREQVITVGSRNGQQRARSWYGWAGN